MTGAKLCPASLGGVVLIDAFVIHLDSYIDTEDEPA